MTGFVTEALHRDHPRESFVSGVAALDRYLRELALQDAKRRIAGCYVAVTGEGEIAGFYTLAATHLPMDALPRETTKKLPRYPVVPAMLMGRLAVATKRQKQGLGRALVADAVIRTSRLGIGAFALVVDAKDEGAVAFYEANDFVRIPNGARRLFLPIATALELREHLSLKFRRTPFSKDRASERERRPRGIRAATLRTGSQPVVDTYMDHWQRRRLPG